LEVDRQTVSTKKEEAGDRMKKKFAIITIALSTLGVLAAISPAGAVKPPQGSTFETGTCATTTGHGSNAIQTTDNGNCNSADNPNQGGTTGGTNTGHGFVPH
jgi:hypothetical protein